MAPRADASSDRIKKTFLKGTDMDSEKVDLVVERSQDLQEVTCLIEERPVVIFSSNAAGEVVVDVRQQDGIKLAGDVGHGDDDKRELASAWLEGQGTNWRDDGSEVVFTLSKGQASIALPKADKPGILTPTNIHPVYGQPDMLFAIAMGIEYGDHTILSGPTGTGKTTAYAFLAQLLNWNFVRVQIDPKTEGASLVGEYLPVGAGHFEWCDGPVTEAVRLSKDHPTILVLDELSRIGNVAELSRLYSLLDDGRRLAIPEKSHENMGEPEVIFPGKLYIGATMNPADDEGADYIGVRELDPALMSRFAFAPEVHYPTPKVETKTLCDRVPGLSHAHAERMVKLANSIRDSAEIMYPMSFRELVAWAKAFPYYGFQPAAEVAFVKKAHPTYQGDIRRLLSMV